MIGHFKTKYFGKFRNSNDLSLDNVGFCLTVITSNRFRWIFDLLFLFEGFFVPFRELTHITFTMKNEVI